MINIVVDIPAQPKGKNPKVIGIDLGLRDIATTSTGKSWNGSQLRATRDKYVRVRASITCQLGGQLSLFPDGYWLE